MEQVNFQTLLTENYYVNPNGIHICFPIKIKKKNNTAANIDGDLSTVNIFFAHWIKEIAIKHLPADTLKTIQKNHLYNKEAVYCGDPLIDRRNRNGDGIVTTGMNAAQIATVKWDHGKDLSIDNRIKKLFHNKTKLISQPR